MTLCLDNLINLSEALEEIANNWEQVITNTIVFHLVIIPSQLFKDLFQLKPFRFSCVSFIYKCWQCFCWFWGGSWSVLISPLVFCPAITGSPSRARLSRSLASLTSLVSGTRLYIDRFVNALDDISGNISKDTFCEWGSKKTPSPAPQLFGKTMFIRLKYAFPNLRHPLLSNVFNKKKAPIFLCNHVVYTCRKDLNYIFFLLNFSAATTFY